MLEKLKSLGEAAKLVLLYILMPFIMVGVFIYYLIRRSQNLTDELKAKEGTEKLKEIDDEKVQIDGVANDAVSEYERLRKAYVQPGSGSVRQSGSGTEKTSGDPGSSSKPE